MNDVVYIVFPGYRVEGIDTWYSVEKLKVTLFNKGIQSKLICFGDYTNDEFSKLSTPLGVILIHVITHMCTVKFAHHLNVVSGWKSIFLNDFNSHDRVSNKLRMYSILNQNNIPIPKTIAINGYSILEDGDADRLIKTFNGDIVVKPYRGFRGQHTFLCKHREELLQSINIIRSNRRLQYEEVGIKGSQVVLQEYVREYDDLYIRIYTTNNHMGGYLGLVAPSEENKFNNFNKYRFRVPYKIEPEVRNMLYKALNVLNINVAACDLLKDDNGYKIMDINAFGAFKTYDAVCKVNFVDKIVECFYNKLISQG
jgi:glutathione synthase/RimK-type ligase-like ATP-grasp enzyme